MPLIRDDTFSLVSCLSCGFLGSNWFFKFKLYLSSLALSSFVFFVFTKDKVFNLIWLYILFSSFIPSLWNTCACRRDVCFLLCKVDFVHQSDYMVQTSAVLAVHVHHEVKILQSFFVPSKHTQTLCGSSRIFCEGDTKPFKNTCLLSTGHFVNKTVSTKPAIQYK